MNEIERLILKLKLNRIADIEVLGNSMLPYLHDGDTVTVKPLSGRKSVFIGDVVVFGINDHLVIHRIVDIIQTHNHIFVKTKGDNNIYDDGYMLLSRVFGVVYEKSKN